MSKKKNYVVGCDLPGGPEKLKEYVNLCFNERELFAVISSLGMTIKARLHGIVPTMDSASEKLFTDSIMSSLAKFYISFPEGEFKNGIAELLKSELGLGLSATFIKA